MSTTTSSTSTKLRLTVRGRRVVASLLLAPAAVFGAVIAVNVPEATATNEVAAAESFRTHTVLAGETLWSIAEDIAGDRDVRDVVAEIQRLNLLESASVQAGQQIALPNL